MHGRVPYLGFAREGTLSPGRTLRQRRGQRLSFTGKGRVGGAGTTRERRVSTELIRHAARFFPDPTISLPEATVSVASVVEDVDGPRGASPP